MTDRTLAAAKSRQVAVDVVVDAHSREFWTNELEVAYDQVMEQVAQPGFIQAWLDKKNGRQVEILRRNMGREPQSGRVKAKKCFASPRTGVFLC